MTRPLLLTGLFVVALPIMMPACAGLIGFLLQFTGIAQ